MNILLHTEISEADDGVAESDGSVVRGTWLQLIVGLYRNVRVI